MSYEVVPKYRTRPLILFAAIAKGISRAIPDEGIVYRASVNSTYRFFLIDNQGQRVASRCSDRENGRGNEKLRRRIGRRVAKVIRN